MRARAGVRLAARLVALVGLLLSAPMALALDVFPGYERLEASEARLLVRLPHGGELTVRTEPAVDVAVVEPGARPAVWTRAPATFEVERGAPERSWHGLSGTVEVALRRADPRVEVRVDLEDGSGAGAAFVWPAEPEAPQPARRWVPAPSVVLAVAGALVAGTLKRRGAKPPHMRFEVMTETDAPLDEVWTWWTDYGRAGDEHQVGHGFGVPAKRRVVEAKDGRVVLAESIPLPVVGGVEVVRHEVRLDQDAHCLHERALEGTPYSSVWRFETTAQNRTRIRREVVAEEGPARFAPAALVKPFAKRDLEHHVHEFERQRAL